MSSDNQFTALGASGQPTHAGFFTDANNITYGVNVQGVDTTHQGCGVYAEAMLHSPGLRKSRDGSRPGVWGVGDHYGVYGASNKLYANQIDDTPLLSPDALTGIDPNDPRAKGGIGVAGASLNVPGVIGTSDVRDSTKGLFVDEIIPHTAGVMGLSNTSIGVMGVNVAVANPNTNAPPQILAMLSPAAPQSNAGIFGWSMSGRGGVFGSAAPVIDGTPAPPPNQGSAQIRILPAQVSSVHVQPQQPPSNLPPSLPLAGQAGDLMAVIGPSPAGVPPATAELWFCIQSGGSLAEPAALWAKVQFSGVIKGNH
jgi:hypothetical protein